MNKVTLPCTPLWQNGKDVHLESYKWLRALGWEFTGHSKYVHEDGRNSYFWILEASEKKLPMIRERIEKMNRYEKVMKSWGVGYCLSCIFPGRPLPPWVDDPPNWWWYLIVESRNQAEERLLKEGHFQNPPNEDVVRNWALYYSAIRMWLDEQIEGWWRQWPLS